MKGKTVLKNLRKIAKEEGFEDEVIVLIADKKGKITASRFLPPNAKPSDLMVKAWNMLWEL